MTTKTTQLIEVLSDGSTRHWTPEVYIHKHAKPQPPSEMEILDEMRRLLEIVRPVCAGVPRGIEDMTMSTQAAYRALAIDSLTRGAR